MSVRLTGADALRFDSTLAEGNINIEMISQGASEIKYVSHLPLVTAHTLAHRAPHFSISSVIDGRDAVKALNLVHHKLLSSSAAGVQVVGPWIL
jgi:aspartate kinase